MCRGCDICGLVEAGGGIPKSFPGRSRRASKVPLAQTVSKSCAGGRVSARIRTKSAVLGRTLANVSQTCITLSVANFWPMLASMWPTSTNIFQVGPIWAFFARLVQDLFRLGSADVVRNVGRIPAPEELFGGSLGSLRVRFWDMLRATVRQLSGGCMSSAIIELFKAADITLQGVISSGALKTIGAACRRPIGGSPGGERPARASLGTLIARAPPDARSERQSEFRAEMGASCSEWDEHWERQTGEPSGLRRFRVAHSG